MFPNTNIPSFIKKHEIECFENFIERVMLLLIGFIWYKVLRDTKAFIRFPSPNEIEFTGPDVLYIAID